MKEYFPKRADILGQKYKVIHRAKKGEDYSNYLGLFHPLDNTIYVDPKQSAEHKWKTLLHEVGHGVMYRNGMRFSGLIPHEVEEIIVETMATAMFECFNQWYPNFYRVDDE